MIEPMRQTHFRQLLGVQPEGSQLAQSSEPRQLGDGERESSPSEPVCSIADRLIDFRAMMDGVFTRSFATMAGCVPAWRLRAAWSDVRSAVLNRSFGRQPANEGGATAEQLELPQR
jgi:hypothetical protein